MLRKTLRIISANSAALLLSAASLYVAIALSACAIMAPSAPPKPNLELGVIDYPNGEVIVNMTGGPSFQSIRSVPSYRAVAAAIEMGGGRVPLASYDRAIAFKPGYWQLLQNYLNDLDRYIQNHCSGGY